LGAASRIFGFPGDKGRVHVSTIVNDLTTTAQTTQTICRCLKNIHQSCGYHSIHIQSTRTRSRLARQLERASELGPYQRIDSMMRKFRWCDDDDYDDSIQQRDTLYLSYVESIKLVVIICRTTLGSQYIFDILPKSIIL
jgi:hypothetical protein